MPQRNQEAKQEMILKLQHYYRNNNKQLKLIKEFAETYKSEDAIQWYTGQPFIYKLINRALRTEDIGQLYSFRFFIIDLCINLKREYEYVKEYEPIITVYRGVRLSSVEVERLKRHDGKLISTNGFLSTSLSKDVALAFADIGVLQKNNVDEQNVLLEIECDLSCVHSVILAPIAQFSKNADEEEVLFDLGASFEILSVEESKKLCKIKLKATDEGTKVAQDYVQLNRKDMKDGTVTIIFGWLLFKMGKFSESLQYFKRLLADPNGEDLPSIHVYIGRVHFMKQNYDEAIEHFQEAYDILIKSGVEQCHLTKLLSEIALVFGDKGEYDKALECFLTDLKYNKESLEPDYQRIASTIHNIGTIYLQTGQYDRALEKFLECLETKQKLYSADHLEIGNCLMSIASVYRLKLEFDRALDYVSKGLEVFKVFLPPEHLSIGLGLLTAGNVLYFQGKYVKALEYQTQALEILKKNFPNGHCDVAKCLDDIGMSYSSLKELDRSLEYFREALKIKETYLPPHHPEIFASLSNVGTILLTQCKYDEALEYYIKSLKIHEKAFPDGHPEIIGILNNIGNAYEYKGELDRALNYFYTCLTMAEKFFSKEVSSEHDYIATILANIGHVLDDQKKHDQALEYYFKALKIRNKVYPDGCHTKVASIYKDIGRV
ncbi:unnamed protein product, partial [Rotaria sp. Silwood2]